jgi:hypothetical protein
MLNQYKNLNQIINTNYAIIGDRFDLTDHNLIDDAISLKEVPNIGKGRVELHIYSNQTWITGNHIVDNIQNNVQLYSTASGISTPINLGTYPIGIDIYNELSNLKLNSGNFRIVVNFFNDLIGSYNNPFIFIDEISPDRTELKLRITTLDNVINKMQVTYFIKTVHQVNPITLDPKFISHQFTDPIHKTYLLNFSRNKILKFINSVVIDGEFLYVKLQDPAPDFVTPKLKCWVTEELRYPYIDRISLQEILAGITYNTLSNANWDAYQSYNVSSETGIKNWNSLLGSSVQTSQEIVDSYFSGSLSGVKLNIDYSDFNNFVFYSSAEARLTNFKYKLELLEYYTTQINTLALVSGSTATTNINDYKLNKTNLIGGFDGFEKYLYYQSSSKLHTYDVPHESPNVANVTGSYVKPLPKSNTTYPYTIYPVTSSQFVNWYDNLIATSSLYDSLNLNKLTTTLPQTVLTNETNTDVITFVDMLGHHFDILYMYINHMSSINKRDENPKLGMPGELLYSVAKQFGWSLQDGNQHHDLWQYALGTDASGIPLTGSNSVGDPSVPSHDLTHAVWRRIVNNLPLLLKSKGTKRSVQALLNCYGIPQSMISINEYGGPASTDNIPIYEKLQFNYALDLINNATGTVNINYNSSSTVNSMELRFKTDDVLTYPTLPNSMNLITISGSRLNVKLNYTRGTLGTLTIYDHNFNTATTNEIELFDGNWLSMLIRKNGTNLDLHVKKAKYGKIVAAVSASISGSFPTNGRIELGGIETGVSRLRGQLQELRLWSSSLNVSVFDNHVKAPSAYTSNINTYNELIYRLPLTQKINHSLTSSLRGVQPISSSISASFANWSTASPYDSLEETQYFDSTSAGNNTYNDNKIRIESSYLNGQLDVKQKAEVSQYDTAPYDSNRVGIYFSPQTMIDEDIIAHMGYINISDYIGDIDNTTKTSYPDLIKLSNQYYKKYEAKSDFNSYIRIFKQFDMSFFQQLDQLLPARSNGLTGLVIQPTLLERNKATILPIVNIEHKSYNAKVNLNKITSISAGYIPYTAVTTKNVKTGIVTITANTKPPMVGAVVIIPQGASITPPPPLPTSPITNVTGSSNPPTSAFNPAGTQLNAPGVNLPTSTGGAPIIQITTLINPSPTIIYNGGTTGKGVYTKFGSGTFATTLAARTAYIAAQSIYTAPGTDPFE